MSFIWKRFAYVGLQGSDTAGYDEYIEGVEPDETASLDAPIKEVCNSQTLYNILVYHV